MRMFANRHRAFACVPLPVFTGSLMLALMPGNAPAQQAAGADEPVAETLEAIVVTARRREESLQDTPVAVTALSADALQRQQIISTTDLDKVAPNLQFHSYGT